MEIRNAALVLFAERGYAATTMADIGEAVGMRGPSLYKHVGSKQELLTQIMTGTMDDPSGRCSAKACRPGASASPR
ncbi:helix-turn-helix domain-containing protein [Streptomyces coeruleorubidus]